jgi:hypothetical protein
VDRKLKKELKLMDINSDNISKQESNTVPVCIPASVSVNHRKTTTDVSASPGLRHQLTVGIHL